MILPPPLSFLRFSYILVHLVLFHCSYYGQLLALFSPQFFCTFRPCLVPFFSLCFFFFKMEARNQIQKISVVTLFLFLFDSSHYFWEKVDRKNFHIHFFLVVDFYPFCPDPSSSTQSWPLPYCPRLTCQLLGLASHPSTDIELPLALVLVTDPVPTPSCSAAPSAAYSPDVELSLVLDQVVVSIPSPSPSSPALIVVKKRVNEACFLTRNLNKNRNRISFYFFLKRKVAVMPNAALMYITSIVHFFFLNVDLLMLFFGDVAGLR